MRDVIEPPHVLARYERRRVGFFRDMEKRGFTVTYNCAYLRLIDGKTFVILDSPKRLGFSERNYEFQSPHLRYWPNWCRVYRFVGHDGGLSNFSLCDLGRMNARNLDLPEMQAMENREYAIHLKRYESVFRIKDGREPKFQPWKTIASGVMRGPPHFDDFLLEWNSPLGMLLDESSRKAGWLHRWLM